MAVTRTQIPQKQVDNTSAAYQVMEPRIRLMNTLMGGTEAMRAAGELYLPRYHAESLDNWRVRLQRATLLNYFQRTVESLVGRPFSKPVLIGDDMPPVLVSYAEDIDQQGTHLNVFCRRSFRDGLMKGLTHILVDYPNILPAETPTKADESALGARPYFVPIKNEDLIAAYAEVQNGVEVLTHVRIRELQTMQSGYDEVTTERIRVLEPGRWELWQKGSKKWEMVEEGVTSLPVIPLVTFYADREDFMVARPPLTDLGDLNISHWQSNSDQINVLTVTRFPILAGAGVDEGDGVEGELKIGPNQYLTTRDHQGKFYYVEHTGKAIEAGRTHLEDLKQEMAVMVLELLQRPGNITATARAIDTAENHSNLQAMVLMYADVVERAFQYAAMWLGMKPEEAGSISINTDFGIQLNEPSDLDTLFKSRQASEISHEAYVVELQRRGVLSDDYDVVVDQKLIDGERDKQLADLAMKAKMQQDGLLPPPSPLPPQPVV